MWKLSFSIVAIAFGSLVVAACVGDATPPAAAAQGELDGACFANGTCNPGLACGVVSGAAKCVLAGDASPGDSSPGTDSGNDSGLPVCSFTPTTYPCPNGPPGAACYGATQTCSLSLCSGTNDLRWSCFSPNQCSTLACCLSPSNGTLSAGKSCAQGAIAIPASATAGASCAASAACALDDIQLCQFNSQCPQGQVCSAVKLVSLGDAGTGSLNGVTIGACAKP
jgi:hypothetical protein